MNATVPEQTQLTHQHTEGPWELGNGYKTARNHAICSGPQILARVNGFGYPTGEGWSAESEANARLMAAAPELLAACERALHHIQTHMGGWEGEVARDTCIAAITKATGNRL